MPSYLLKRTMAFSILVGAIFVYCCCLQTFVEASATTAAEHFVLAQQRIEAPPECGPNSEFGSFVTMSGDGQTAAASCYNQHYVFFGYVFVFARSNATGLWTQQAMLNGTDKSIDAYEGAYLSFSHDGNTLASGAHLNTPNQTNSEGSVFIYVRDANGVWSQQAMILNPAPLVVSGFGYICQLSADGNTLAVIPGFTSNASVYVFTRTGVNWILHSTLVPNLVGYSLTSVTISSDAQRIAYNAAFLSVAPPYNTIEFFDYANGTWTQATAPPPIIASGFFFLTSLSFAQGAENLYSIFGDTFVGFEFNGTGYDLAYQLQDSQFVSFFNLATDETGKYLMIGHATSKQATVLWRDSITSMQYQKVQDITKRDAKYFGRSLHMSRDGTLAIISALGTGEFEGSIFFYQRMASSGVCQPTFGINKATCKRRMMTCAKNGIHMKWAGPGCKNKKGKKMRDGGCQCGGYCGYSCKKACKKDKECRWTAGICYVKATGGAGIAKPYCN